MNLKEFGQQVKAKYPVYNNLSDEDVANKVIAKYPVYKSQITEETKKTGFFENIGNTLKNTFGMGGAPSAQDQATNALPGALQAPIKAANAIGSTMNPINQATGVVRGAASIFGNLAKGAEGLFGQTQDPASATAKKWGDVTPNAGQAIGKFATQTGVYGGIGAGVGAIAEGAGAGSGLLSRIGQSATVGGLGTGAISGTKEGAEWGAVLGGAIPIVGSLISKFAPSIGQKIEMSLIKPTSNDVADGFKVDTISKYDLGGSLQDTASKTHNMITDLAGQLRDKLGSASGQIDLTEQLANVESDISSNQAKTFGANTKIDKAIRFFTDEINKVAPNGVVDINDAQDIKRSLGKIGAWQYGKTDPESTAIETVANRFYTYMKTAIENVSPDGVKEINQKLGELIPVENAVIRRIPIAERSNMIGLSDIVSAIPGASNPANFWLFFLNKLSKSGQFASTLMKAGKESATPVGKMIFGK